jgi:type IV pilus assembly protein PilY1
VLFSDTLDDIAWLWSAGRWLAELDDPTIQRVYDQAEGRRYIITGIDSEGGDGLVGAEEERPFLTTSFDGDTLGLLQAGDEETAERIVAYIRGADQPGMRPRRIDHDGNGVVETWRLGDIVYGTPVVVGGPAENLDLLYRDAGYRDFARRYRDRRRVVVAGANDGMLHAFNGGFYDARFGAFRRGTPSHELGAELWAYVPYNLLPHLRYLTDPAYGRDGSHICFVDLQPVVFDARIFHDGGPLGQPGADHPHGWGTLLVGGMRFGGREMSVQAAPGRPASVMRTLRSSYFILDVTDPEKAPKLLLEFTHPELGYTVSRPTPVKVGDDWYLMLGSGPYPADARTLEDAGSGQAGRLFLLDLRRMAPAEDFGEGGVLKLATPKSFVSDLAAVDFDFGDGAYSVDAVYFGTVAGSPGDGWSGSIQRVRIGAEGTPPAPAPPQEWCASVLLQTAKPMAGGVNVGLDLAGNRWVFAGSGRYFTQADGDDVTSQRFFGVREPCSVGGGQRAFTWGEADLSGLKDVTPVVMRSDDPAVRTVFEALRDDIDENHGGWYLELEAEGERAAGRASLLADLLSFTTFTPNRDLCADGGSGSLYAVHFATGSAGWEPAVRCGSENAGDNPADGGQIAREIPLGKGFCTLPSLHVGKEKGVKVYLQSSSGAITVVEERPPGVLHSGPVHWELW